MSKSISQQDWEKLIAELDERHGEDVYNRVVTILQIHLVDPLGDLQFTGAALYCDHAPDVIRVELGFTNQATWFGKELNLCPKNVVSCKVLDATVFVLKALELANNVMSEF